MSNTTTINVPEAIASQPNKQTITAAVHFLLSQSGQVSAVLAGLPAQKQQVLTGEIPVSDLELCEILPDGSVAAATAPIPGAPRQKGWGDLLVETITFDRRPATAAEALAMYRAVLDARKAKEAARLESRAAKALAGAMADVRKMEEDPGYIPQMDRSPWYSLPNNLREQLSAAIEEIGRRVKARKDEEQQKAWQQKEAERVHAEEKHQFVTDWLRTYGSANQQERWAAGLLPVEEYLPAMEEQAFSPLSSFTRLGLITEDEVRRAFPADDCDADEEGIDFRSIEPSTVSAELWDLRSRLLAVMPKAVAEFREHQGERASMTGGSGILRTGVRVSVAFGPFTFVREFGIG